jgi:hypothetical protein
VALVGCLNVLFKGVVGVALMMWVRWTLPRLRIDQVMTTCLKYCTPIAAVMFLGVITWQLLLPGRTFFGILEVRNDYYALHEYWGDESHVAVSLRETEFISRSEMATLPNATLPNGISRSEMATMTAREATAR